MTTRTAPSPDRGQATTQTIAVAATAMQTVIDRTDGMPGIAVLSGAPGLGKTSAAVYLSHPAGFNAVYVRCRSFETTKSLSLLLLAELAITPRTSWSTAMAFERICEALTISTRPLVVDEVDYIAESKTINMLRDLHDTAHVPLFLIGEEGLKKTLGNSQQRFHDRVLVWSKAMPADASDLDKLTRHYAPELVLEPDAKRHLLATTQGVARRIVTALAALKEHKLVQGADTLNLADVQTALRAVR